MHAHRQVCFCVPCQRLFMLHLQFLPTLNSLHAGFSEQTQLPTAASVLGCPKPQPLAGMALSMGMSTVPPVQAVHDRRQAQPRADSGQPGAPAAAAAQPAGLHHDRRLLGPAHGRGDCHRVRAADICAQRGRQP